jgi:hypothetical protein
MGIFQHLVPVVNVGRVELTVTFDGQQITLPVGESHLPELTIPYAKNQNPVMGSQSPDNPSLSGMQSLIRRKDKDNCEPMTDEEWQAHCEAACRMDWYDLVHDRLKPGEKVVVKGKKSSVQARSRGEMGVAVGGQAMGVLGVTDRSE